MQTSQEVTIFRQANHWKARIINRASSAVFVGALEFRLAFTNSSEGV